MLDKDSNQAIALHQDIGWSFEELIQKAPSLPRGWYELSRISLEERVEFTYSYWLSKLPFMSDYDGKLQDKLEHFFQNIEEIGIYLVQTEKAGLYIPHMVYNLKHELGYFQGGPPADHLALEYLIKSFGFLEFPADYLAFLLVHDGFSKYTDRGLLKSKEVVSTYQRLQHLLKGELLTIKQGLRLDPLDLVPFYESYELHSYQCFYAKWQTNQEIGNIFFSEHDRQISNFFDSLDRGTNRSFPSFIEWLIFYLEEA